MTNEIHRRISDISKRLRHLSLDELRAVDDLVTDLERGEPVNPRGCLHRFNTPRSRALVGHFSDEPTVERDPFSPSSSALPHRSDDAETANAGRGVVAGDLSEVVR